MNTIQTTEAFDAWFVGLKDRQAIRRVQVRTAVPGMATLAIAHPLVKVYQKCEFITGRKEISRLNPLPVGEETIALSPAGGKLDRGLGCISYSAVCR